MTTLLRSYMTIYIYLGQLSCLFLSNITSITFQHFAYLTYANIPLPVSRSRLR